MVQVMWTDEALHCIAEIYCYIAQDSPKNAEHFLNSLIDSTEKQLKLSAYIGRITPEFENTMKREIIYNNYRVLYNVEKNGLVVYITQIQHVAKLITQNQH